jgi:hypothetical protein
MHSAFGARQTLTARLESIDDEIRRLEHAVETCREHAESLRHRLPLLDAALVDATREQGDKRDVCVGESGDARVPGAPSVADDGGDTGTAVLREAGERPDGGVKHCSAVASAARASPVQSRLIPVIRSSGLSERVRFMLLGASAALAGIMMAIR